MTRTLVNPVMRTVPRDWQTQLAELWPRSEQTSWPRLRWEPGYPWEPVERWIIDEMIPADAVIPDVLEQLQRATPPQGHWDAALDEYIRQDDSIITTTAWKLFRETGCWARPFWVIQGKHGGHKRWFSESEKKLLRYAGLPSDPPAPGDLPYAPFDTRVLKQLAQHDLLRDLNGKVRAHLGKKKILTLAGYRRQEDENARDFRKMLLGWLSSQLPEQGAELTRAMQTLDAPRRDLDVKLLEEASEQAEQTFVETGRAGSAH